MCTVKKYNITCKICKQKIFTDYKRLLNGLLTKHIKYHHKDITIKEYYDKYLLKEGNDICYCENIKPFRNIGFGYEPYCSSKCGHQNPEKQIKRKKTSKLRYGDENYNNLKQQKQTIFEKYGVTSVFEIPGVQEKIKATNLERYGVEHNFKGKFGTRPCDITVKKKYGVDNIFSSDKFRKKSIKTWLENYGVDNPFKAESIKIKAKETKLAKYGYEYYNNRDKAHDTCMKKYGVGNTSLLPGNNKAPYKIKEYKTIFGNIIHYQSKPELAFIKECENKNIEIWNGEYIRYFLNNKKRYYYVDFKIKKKEKFQLIEIKGKNPYYYASLEDGTFDAKCKAARKYSKDNNYLPYKLIFC